MNTDVVTQELLDEERKLSLGSPPFPYTAYLARRIIADRSPAQLKRMVKERAIINNHLQSSAYRDCIRETPYGVGGGGRRSTARTKR